jgi:antagonist of KipI
VALKIVETQGGATVQDLGRPGYQRYGVSPSGAMDWYAHRAANRLVGNAPDAAGVEASLADQTFVLTEAGLISVTGNGFELYIQGRARPLWTALFVQAEWSIELRKTSGGTWAYLAVAGGLQTAPILGSRATYTRGGFGGVAGRPLQAGDVLPAGPAPKSPLALAGSVLPAAQRPAYSQTPILEVMLGPQADAFTPEGIETFFSARYSVSTVSDRMGYRLEGDRIAHQAGADIISDGLARGSIQVPASGQPLVMMSDRPTTGGYPKIATLATADVPVLAQCSPGTSQVRFRAITVEAAQARYHQLMLTLTAGIQTPEPDWPGF